MGLWAWTINQLLSPKFFRSYRREGFLRTYNRGHRASGHPHDIGGRQGLVKSVGQDQFGNVYYEDLQLDGYTRRRWVEMADYFLPVGITGDRVPPGWHGWLVCQCDDSPVDELFVKHFYLKPHTGNRSYTPLAHQPLGSPQNPNRFLFINQTRARKSNPWALPESGAKTIGKKIIVERKPYFEDPTADL